MAGLIGFLAALALAGAAGAQTITDDLQSQWSDSQNPNGHWSMLEGPNILPHVDGWERGRGSYAMPQPAWAESEDGNNRIPMFERSNGSETFGHDWVAGDILTHSTDGANGVGNGPGSIAWTAPATGIASITGHVWPGRDIGRTVEWSIRHNTQRLTGQTLSSGDPFSRASPMALTAGDGGAAAITDIALGAGDVLGLRFDTIGTFGDFIGIVLTVELTPSCPADFDGDGFVTGLDFDAFVAAFEAGDISADFDGDGFITGLDFDAYVLAFEAGC